MLSQSAVAVEKIGTENEVVLFNLHFAEGWLGFMGQLAKGMLSFWDSKFYCLENQQRGKALMNSLRSAHPSRVTPFHLNQRASRICSEGSAWLTSLRAQNKS